MLKDLTSPDYTAPDFDARFQTDFEKLVLWRRDERHFRPDPVDEEVFQRLIDLSYFAPSVGNSQPWRFVRVDSATCRGAVIKNFNRANSKALADYKGERAALYARLKLAGLQQAPVHLAVFTDENTEQGHRLGRKTMPEMLRYSTVTAVHTIWLAARAYGLGVGWVSILQPAGIGQILDVPHGWKLVAYLCIGYPAMAENIPELERKGWEQRHAECRTVLRR
ncbi:MAG: 5,6-dimethylbenzimidazole synthase [Alphaproteobacteria bacterium]|nr:5,6-dimethylbenzimidazole synthase [Alphaproteobacteria bacterium]